MNMKKITVPFLLATLVLITACGPLPSPATSEPTQEPLPTSTSYPTFTPYPTHTPYPTLPVATEVSPTLTSLPTTPAAFPAFLVEVISDKAPLREVCQNKKGEYKFNAAGYPLLFECIWSSDGSTSGRVVYHKGDLVAVYWKGDTLFRDIYGGKLTVDGNAQIRTDGGFRYFMVSGPRGGGLFIDVSYVRFYDNLP